MKSIEAAILIGACLLPAIAFAEKPAEPPSGLPYFMDCIHAAKAKGHADKRKAITSCDDPRLGLRRSGDVASSTVTYSHGKLKSIIVKSGSRRFCYINQTVEDGEQGFPVPELRADYDRHHSRQFMCNADLTECCMDFRSGDQSVYCCHFSPTGTTCGPENPDQPDHPDSRSERVFDVR